MVELKDIPILSAFFPKAKEEERIIPIIYNEKNVTKEEETKEGTAIVASTKSSFSIGSVDKEEQNTKEIELFFEAYRDFPIVAAAIDSKVEQVVQDFRIDGPQSKDLMNWADKVNFKHHLRIIAKHGLIGGTHWAEKVKLVDSSAKGLGRLTKPFSFKHLDPIYMSTIRTKKGKILAQLQDVNNKKIFWGTKTDEISGTKAGELEDIFCWKWNVIADAKYGRSIIKSVISNLMTKGKIETDLRVIAKRYLAPIIHATIGDELHYADESQVSSMQSELEDIYSDTEYVTNHLVELKTLDLNNKSVDFKPILDHMDNQIITGLQTQAILMSGSVGGDKASDKGAEVKLRANTRHIKAIQDELALTINEQVFAAMTGNTSNKLIWEAIEERQLEADVDMLVTLVKNGVLTQQKANDLLPDQYRETLPEPEMLEEPEEDQSVEPDKKVKDPNNPTKSSLNTNLNSRSKDSKVNPTNAKAKPQKMENKRML